MNRLYLKKSKRIKNFLLPGLLLLIMPAAFTQSIWQASAISPALISKAHLVKREEKIFFKVKSVDNAMLNVHQVFTILDEAGEDALYFMQFSDKFQELSEAEIKVFDGNGRQLNKYKKREMNSQAIGEGLVVDAKAYFFRVTAQSFPCTVQYDYEINYHGILNYPDFQIQKAGEAIENASFIATVPAELDMRFKPQNISLNPVITLDGKNKIYDWEVKSLEAIKFEEGAANKNRYPRILLSPNKFSLDGKEGDMTSWKNFGAWLNNLYSGLDELPEERNAFFKDMVKEAKSDRQKAAIIYHYLQKNFRYVSIQLGIGGLRPFSAIFTDKKKYGDCKGLSNYMKAALNAVGINSYVAIINAEYNSEPVDALFPDNGFNHVILCIPAANDTTWLECTSTTTEFGVLGTFTENRNALLVTKNGGVLVQTPKSKSSDNTFMAATSVNIEEDASGIIKSSIFTTGEHKQILMDVLTEKDDEKKSFLVNYLGYKHPDIYTMTQSGDSLFEVKVGMEMEKIPEFQAGSKMFIAPRCYRLTNALLSQREPRRLDYYFRFPEEKTDTTIYHLPEDYTVEALPKARNIIFDSYSFKTSYAYNEKENIITTTAKLILKQNRIPAQNYLQTQRFFNEVLQESAEKLIIKKK